MNSSTTDPKRDVVGSEATLDRPRRPPNLLHGIKEWLREPLLHFVLIGAAIFAAYGHFGRDARGSDRGDRIVLTQDDLRQLAVQWLAQGRPPPSRDEMRSLVEQKVAQEILYREALALGLDKNDEMIRRRLAQKMDFLAEDIAALQEPSEAELRSWFAKNSSRFALAPRASFRHLYFSADRGPATRDAAMAALSKVVGKPADVAAAAAGADAFMFRDFYAERTPEQIAKEFGPDFAKGVLTLETGAWRGAIQSGYGWHLVFVEAKEEGRVPAFEEVIADVKSVWIDEKQRGIKRRAFDAMRARYTVVVPPLDALDWGSLRKMPLAATAVMPE